MRQPPGNKKSLICWLDERLAAKKPLTGGKGQSHVWVASPYLPDRLWRNWHLPFCAIVVGSICRPTGCKKGGCRASLGRLPPPLLIRAREYSVVLVTVASA